METLKITLTDDRSTVYVNVDKLVSIGPVEKTGFRIPVFYKYKCSVATVDRNYVCLCTDLDKAAAGEGFNVSKEPWFKDERSMDIIEDTLYTTADGGEEIRTKSEMDKFQQKYEKNDPRNK